MRWLVNPKDTSGHIRCRLYRVGTEFSYRPVGRSRQKVRHCMIAEEVRAKIIDRYRTSGLSLREVGKEFSVSAPSVRAILIKAGVPITGSTYFKESGMPKRPWHPTNTKAVAKVLAKRMEGMPTKEIAKSTDMTVCAVRKIISEGEIDQCVRDSKGRVAGMLEKALDVAEFHLELNDKAVAMQIIQGS